VCGTCRAVEFGHDPRDANCVCSCDDPDSVFIRWYGCMYAVAWGCIVCSKLAWWMDLPGAKLHPITDGIANVYWGQMESE